MGGRSRYPITGLGLTLAGVHAVAVKVHGEGVDVELGRELAPQAALAVLTPGQQAPNGVTLSGRRRSELLRWAGIGRMDCGG